MSVIAAQALSNPETQENIIKGIGIVATSAPVIAAATIGAIFVSWQLEHLSFETIDIPVFDTFDKVVKYTVNVERAVVRTVERREGDPSAGTRTFIDTEIVQEQRVKIVKERIQVGTRRGRGFVRLSTADTSFLKDPNRTPLMPPIQSTAIRLADAGSDVAEAAFALAQQQLETVKSGGLIRAVQQFIFGG